MGDVAKRPPLATAAEVAEYRRTTEATLAQERYRGIGPRYKKLGKRVFYDWADVYAWVDAHSCQRTDDAATAK
ncbi:helix-turn-helix transcriptional regulator [Rhodococcus spongiicola]|uniref:DNA-binding protein n=1 Tax=Rhodococcus spongiicola TaxID=2487352 RepID=A0A3S3ACK7_9NOCA|nr:DNA-binding protein [Rhodococcus spongiicola]RVW04895.1 DNA-binding protein [Rhodococcus spongiicola]